MTATDTADLFSSDTRRERVVDWQAPGPAAKAAFGMSGMEAMCGIRVMEGIDHLVIHQQREIGADGQCVVADLNVNGQLLADAGRTARHRRGDLGGGGLVLEDADQARVGLFAAAIRGMNDRFSEQENPAGLAVRANGDRQSRLKEIMLELSGIAKDQHP